MKCTVCEGRKRIPIGKRMDIVSGVLKGVGETQYWDCPHCNGTGEEPNKE